MSFWIISLSLLTRASGAQVTPTWCKDNKVACSSFCQVRPADCDEVCRQMPDIAGCTGEARPPVPCKEPESCCQKDTAECHACKACTPVTEYCATNRAVPGCEEVCCELGCSEQCKNVHHTTIKIERQCKWKVVNQQFEAFRPRILQANVEKSCPFMTNYELHLESCQACSRLHQPCNDTYIACGGCCGTPWHSLLGLAINTNHDCAEIKNYFAKKNSATVECEEANETNKDEPAGDVGMTVHNSTEEVIDEGTLNSTCETNVTSLECKKIPFVLKFECDDCGNKGTPDLLDQCCDKCIEWSNSLADHKNIDKDIMPYVWCSGCDATEIKPLNPIFPPMPWLNAPKYATHTEDKAYEAVDLYLENEVCSALPNTCPAELPTSDPRRLEESTEECYSEDGGTCASYDYPELIVNMSVCTDPRFPYQNTNPQRRQFCYSTQAYADARTGPCESWCSLSTGGPVDNDGCDGCCGDFNAKKCDPEGGRRLRRRLQSPPKETVQHVTASAAIMCQEFDPTFYQQAKPRNDVAGSTTNMVMPTVEPVPITTMEPSSDVAYGFGPWPAFMTLFYVLGMS